MKLTEAAVDAVIADALEYIAGDSRVFAAVVASLSVDDLEAAAEPLGYTVVRRSLPSHSIVSGRGGWAFGCTCGWNASTPCPSAPRFA